MWKKLALGSAAAYVGYRYLSSKGAKQTLPPAPDGRKRCIFITGAASGIGRETVKTFISRGWFVGAYDINIDALKSLYGDVGEDNVCFSFLDVIDEVSCDLALEHFLQRTNGFLDVLFNCAGMLTHAPFEDTPLPKLITMIRVNCEGVVQLTHKALPALKKTKDSRVITMASMAAMGGIPKEAVYAATKVFVYSFTESMRIEMYLQVLFADISVGFVDTPMVQSQDQNQYTKEVKKELKSISPDMVVEKVWQAVHECDYNNEHFYVKSCDYVFALNFVLRAFKSPLNATLRQKMLWDE
mmetsp:Transcript_29324/g.36252  ORF Transcript_29324/g.36252 Transcript_29324/m.36252 type:complete len:298 (-) Transcript_29324:232-1125(-)